MSTELLGNAPPESPVMLRREADVERGYASIDAGGQIKVTVLPDEAEFAIINALKNTFETTEAWH